MKIHLENSPTKKWTSPTEASSKSPKISVSATTSSPSSTTIEQPSNKLIITPRDIATVYYSKINDLTRDIPIKTTGRFNIGPIISFLNVPNVICMIQHQLQYLQDAIFYESNTFTFVNWNKYLGMYVEKIRPIGVKINGCWDATNPFNISVLAGDIDAIFFLGEDVLMLSAICETPEDRDAILKYIESWSIYTQAYVQWFQSLGNSSSDRLRKMLEIRVQDEKHVKKCSQRYARLMHEHKHCVQDLNNPEYEYAMRSILLDRIQNTEFNLIADQFTIPDARIFVDHNIKISKIIDKSEWCRGQNHWDVQYDARGYFQVVDQ